MRALVWDGSNARVVQRDPPAPAPGRAIVRVTLAGICNTDLEIVRGYMGFRGVLGHELVGVVADGPPEWVGRRVVSEINFACGACEACARGLGRHCPHRTVMGIASADGAIAELVSVPVANLHLVPDGVPDDHAVFAEPLAAAFEVLEQVHVVPGRSALVLGDGKLGLLVAQVLHAAGAHVTAVGRHESKLAILGARGIETLLERDFEPRPRHDLVVEATGSASGFGLAVASTRPRGTIVLKSTVADRLSIDAAPIVVNEITIVGSRCGSFAPAVRALVTSSIDVGSLVSARVPLEHADTALEEARAPGVLKVLVQTDPV